MLAPVRLTQWQSPLLQPQLGGADVHIWRAALDCPAATLAHYHSLLSADEHTRADRFKFAEHRQHFIVARGILRTLLGRYLTIAPKQLQFVYGSRGKPALAHDTVQFNLAHSQSWALYAIRRDRPIGIDLEHLRPVSDLTALAQRYFAAREYAALVALPVAQQPAAFLRYWTCKEAYLKATGSGLAQLKGLEIALFPHQPACLVSLPDGAALSQWQLQELAPGDGLIGAIVTTSDPWQATHWQFTSS